MYFLLFLASTVLFKWTDAKGQVHITDRLTEVPAKHRAAFAKQLEEREKKKDKPVEVAPPPPVSQNDAYAKYQRQKTFEKETKAKTEKMRDRIGEARVTVSKLEEEYGTLAANPVLNAAQPIRKERMAELEKQIAEENDVATKNLEELHQMIKSGIPEDWVTGL